MSLQHSRVIGSLERLPTRIPSPAVTPTSTPVGRPKEANPKPELYVSKTLSDLIDHRVLRIIDISIGLRQAPMDSGAASAPRRAAGTRSDGSHSRDWRACHPKT